MNRMNMANQMYAKGDEVRRQARKRLPGRFENVAEKVASGRRPGTTGPNVQRNIPGRMTGVADKVLTGSGRPPVGTMATPKTGLLPTQTLSRMGTLSRGGIGGLIAAGGLGLFEIGRQTGFEPEKLGQAAAQVQKSIEEVASEAVEVARELGQPIQDFVNRVVQGYQSEMGGSDRLERIMMGGQGRTISNMDRDRVSIDIPRSLDEMRYEDIQERNLMQQEQMFFPTQNSLGRQLAKFQKRGIPEMTMTLEERLNKITDPIMQAIENEKERYSDQMSRGFAAGDEVDVAALPKGLKAMYDSGPKGREGVENIAAKTDKFAEGGAVENEIDEALSDIQNVAPEAQAIGQIMTMVMEMIQAGASEEQVIQALMQMGLDEEDIQQVMMMIAEQMQGQDPIQSQLSQMM